jgi:hypothetical protein
MSKERKLLYSDGPESTGIIQRVALSLGWDTINASDSVVELERETESDDLRARIVELEDRRAYLDDRLGARMDEIERLYSELKDLRAEVK